ncbi:MAG: 50S ribosomal protein L24 [Dehalococcoidia bacterium]
MLARLKRDDEVTVIRGRDKGKRGKVQRVFSDEGTVLVEGVNIVKRHQKAGGTGARQAGIISKEMPINASKVMPVCPSCQKPTRIGVKAMEDGTRARMCKRCEGMLN